MQRLLRTTSPVQRRSPPGSRLRVGCRGHSPPNRRSRTTAFQGMGKANGRFLVLLDVECVLRTDDLLPPPHTGMVAAVAAA